VGLPDSKYLRADQLQKVLAVLKAGENPDRDRMLILLSSALGLRVTEAVRVEKSWFRDIDKQWVWVRSAKKRHKGGPGERPEERLAVPKGIIAFIKGYMKRLEGKWFFTGRTKAGHMSERQAFNVFSGACVAAGIGHKSFHALRHYRGFTVQSKTWDLDLTRRQLRHTSVAATQRYTERTPDEEKELADEIGWN